MCRYFYCITNIIRNAVSLLNKKCSKSFEKIYKENHMTVKPLGKCRKVISGHWWISGLEFLGPVPKYKWGFTLLLTRQIRK